MVKKMRKSRKRTKNMKRRSKAMRRKYSKKMKRRSRAMRRRSKTMRKRSRVKRRRPKRKRSRRRRKIQRGGVLLGGKKGCINPFQGVAAVNGASGGNYYKLNDHQASDIIRGQLSRQLTGSRPMRGGGTLLRDLGLTFPKDLYNDTVDYLTNVKNTYTGDKQDSTSDVLKQGISNTEEPKVNLPNYSDYYNTADKEAAKLIKTTMEAPPSPPTTDNAAADADAAAGADAGADAGTGANTAASGDAANTPATN